MALRTARLSEVMDSATCWFASPPNATSLKSGFLRALLFFLFLRMMIRTTAMMAMRPTPAGITADITVVVLSFPLTIC